MASLVLVRPVAVPNPNDTSNALIPSEGIVYQQDPQPPLKGIAKMLRQTRQCKHFLRGSCRYGDKCGFAHSDSVKDRPNLVKTKMCARFEKGLCDKGAKCHFAHSQTELRQITNTSNSSVDNSAWASTCKPGEAGYHFRHTGKQLGSGQDPSVLTQQVVRLNLSQAQMSNQDVSSLVVHDYSQDYSSGWTSGHGKHVRNQFRPLTIHNKAVITESAFPVTAVPYRFVEDQYLDYQEEQPRTDDERVTPRLCPGQEQDSYSRSSTPPPEHVVFGYGMHPDLVPQSHNQRLDMLS
eukprot:gnl/MRDRNA2_/MRDRNA2_18473_c0_seq1.p1 gnl/MRDRNA2_/MRDRNA2_18473_c0~~gnl/MRDRNA2_/MRDRNA2_18473_c0_seq1.p1  ORF type:complete len:293 (+),score=35.20 gnl/MRDRNA2_/MRDRNA2_18473_c0_seq1:70-948(+)